MRFPSSLLFVLAFAAAAAGQTSAAPTAPASSATLPALPTLTLQQAEQTAVRNHPQLQAAQFNAQAAKQDARATSSYYYPTANADVTGALATTGARIAAGALNNPIVYDREADGITVSQLISDFGRTGSLVQSSRLASQAAASNVVTTRADVLLTVTQAYYDTLRMQALMQVAQQTVSERQVVANQVNALEKSQLKSGLDLSFAMVNLAQAKLDLVQANSNLQTSFATLAEAMGLTTVEEFQLQQLPAPPQPPSDVQPLLAQALAQRPELASLQFTAQADAAYAKAEGEQERPTLSAVATAGVIPSGESPLPNNYAAVGANLSIPIFNGFLFSSQHEAAKLRSQAADQQLRDEQDVITHDVRAVWLQDRTNFANLDLTQQLLDQATLALKLAQSRYTLGLSSIVELSQAQLNLTQAQIQHTDAVYDFQISENELAFEIGNLR